MTWLGCLCFSFILCMLYL